MEGLNAFVYTVFTKYRDYSDYIGKMVITIIDGSIVEMKPVIYRKKRK